MRNNKYPYIIFAILAIFAIVMTIIIVQAGQNDTPADRLNNAVEDITDGVDDAAKELDPNRTPAEKMGDAVEEVGDDIQDATRP